MKIKDEIIKLQQGGIPLPVFTYNPLSSAQNVNPTGAEQQSAPADKEGNNSKKELIKNLLDQIKTRGLPSDIESFFGSFSGMFPSFFGNSQSFSGMNSGDSNDVDSMINNYVSLLPKLNRIEFNKENWDKSMAHVTKNEALDEYAVTSNGLMVVYDEDGKLTQLRQGDYLENSDKYQPLTNSELANMRANNPNLAWDTNIFSSLNSSIGTNKITEQVLNIITKVGKEKYTTDTYDTKASAIAKGMQTLMGNGPENVFYKSENITASEKKNAQEALKYIYSTLPNNSRAVLKTRAAIMGMNPDKGVLELLSTLVSGTTSHETSTKLSIEKDPNHDYTAAGSKDKQKDYTPLEQFVNMEGVEKQFLLTPGKGYAYNVPSVYHSQFIDPTGKAIGQTNLMDMLTGSGLGGQVDMNAVYIGDKKADVSDLSKVLYMGTGAGAAWLPYTVDEHNRQKVDYKLLDNFSEAYDTIKRKYPNGNAPAVDVETIFKSKGVTGVKYDPSTGALDWDRSRFAKFAMLEVAASNGDDIIKDADESILLTENNSDNLKKLMVEKLNTKDNPLKVKDIYTGIAFVPIIGNSRTAQNASNNYPTVKRPGDGTYYDTKATEAHRQNLATFRSANKQTNNLYY